MGLTAASGKPRKPVKQAHPLANLYAILDQLDSEWETLEQDGVEAHGHDEAALLAYYHACMRPALHWIDGDPYGVQFPAEYQQERLAKMCRWLRGLKDADRVTVKKAREQMLANLKAVWPAYCSLVYPDMPADWPGSVYDWEVPPFSFNALMGDSENWQQAQDSEQLTINFLPAFRYRESADFHLAALAVLFLNRQLRYYLTDLHPHPTDIDGLGQKDVK